MTWRIFLEESDYFGVAKLHAGRLDHEDRLHVLEPAVVTVRERGAYVADPKPFMAGRGSDIEDFLQSVLDFAWERGMRPRSFEPVTGELRAVKDHLADMRKLAKVPGA